MKASERAIRAEAWAEGCKEFGLTVDAGTEPPSVNPYLLPLVHKGRRPWRRCVCGGVCHWHETDWVCEDCGDEWNEEHDARFAAPGDSA